MARRRDHVMLLILVVIGSLSVAGCSIQIIEGSGFSLFALINPFTGQTTALVEEIKDDCFEGPASVGTLISCFLFDAVTSFVAVSEYVMKFPNDVQAKQFRDPLVAQLPLSVSGVSGTFTGAASGAVSVQSGLNCVKTVPGEQLCAEAGQQLVVLDLPSNAPAGRYRITLNFTVTPPAPVTVKAVLTGRVVVAGETFYPVLVPCLKTFAGAPSVTIPLSTTLVGIPLPIAGVTPCVGRTIDFTQLATTVTSIPTLGHGAFLALAVLMALVAVYWLSARARRASRVGISGPSR
jgi:hypothetical protein